MKTALLVRDSTGDQGTFGLLTTSDGEHAFHTLELPFRDLNGDGVGDPQKSCITVGAYSCKWMLSPHHGWCYHVLDVPQRSGILIHPANFAGDVDLGWQSELLGCIALGMAAGQMLNKSGRVQRALVRNEHDQGSRAAVALFNAWGDEGDITLTIKGSP